MSRKVKRGRIRLQVKAVVARVESRGSDMALVLVVVKENGGIDV